VTKFFTLRKGPRLHIDDTGGKGLPVVFQHGLCGDAKQPAEVFPKDKAFRRITVECRGHGASEAGHKSAFSIARSAEDLAEVIEHMGLGPVVVGGISMGAAIAIRLCVTRPELIRGLIIARPAWIVAKAPGNMQPNAEVGRLLGKFAPPEALRRFNSGPTAKHLQRLGPDNLVSLRSFFTREPIAVTAALLSRISADRPGVTWAQLRAIAVLTLVIGHSNDYVHPFAMAQQIADLIPRSKLVAITPKAVDKARYINDFQFVLHDFLEGF
jgi:pimeloyl-ACP methyl ester carboxylesterase